MSETVGQCLTPEQQNEIEELRAKLKAAEKHLEIKEGAIRIMGSQIQQMQPRSALLPEMLEAIKALMEDYAEFDGCVCSKTSNYRGDPRKCGFCQGDAAMKEAEALERGASDVAD